MKKNIVKIINLFLVMFFIFSFTVIKASNEFENRISKDEYSEEYKQWQELDEEEKEKTLQPKMYDILTQKNNRTYLNELDNVFKVQQLLKANISAKYNLKDIISENVVIRNQMSTNSCWAFASIGMLESHLGLRDYNNQKTTTVYDFSEKHMNYSTAKSAFLNDEINEYGFSKKLSDGGSFYLATQYMANGLGVINESDLPFVDSEENIDISEIQNKEVQATLYNTVEFPATYASERAEIMPQIKEHIVNYGGIYAGIHGADITGDSYNNETGAIYCTSTLFEPSDHAVVIIGWDDNYSIDNFNENQRPTENGAWIIKNSWGDEITENLSEVKQVLFEQNESYCESMGWDTPDKIPDDKVLETYQNVYGEDKVKIQDGNIIVEMGDKGYMYVSYEDCNVYKNLIGIEKATNTKDYDNVYAHDTLGPSYNIKYKSEDVLNLANVFARTNVNNEYLDKISVYTFQGYTCKVLVNPNGNSKAKEDLQEVKLKTGETETFEPGYHTIEFAEPIKLTGDSFVVVIQVITDDYYKEFALERPVADSMWQDAVYNEGESYCASENDFNNNSWADLATMEDETLRGNLCIKAYTTLNSQTEEKALEEIYIKKAPNKTEYVEGEDFDKTGMTVFAKYSDGSEQEITNYTIIGGENLSVSTESVTIQYTENGETKITTQAIVVKEKEEVTDPDEPDNPEEKPENPTLSDFENAKSIITESKLYFSSTDLSKATSENTVEISGIKIGDESNNYTYYYYISGTQGDTDITNWTEAKAEKEDDGTYSITLNLKSEELKNYEEIAESDVLYVYIKEVAQIDNQTAEQVVTLNVENDSEPECYIDGVFVGGIDDVLNYNSSNNSNSTNNSNTNQNKDNTVATGILPYAGGITFKVIIAILIITFGCFAYYRYKNIDR